MDKNNDKTEDIYLATVFDELREIYQDFYYSTLGVINSAEIFPDAIKNEITKIEKRMVTYNQNSSIEPEVSEIFKKHLNQNSHIPLSNITDQIIYEEIQKDLKAIGLTLQEETIYYSNEDDLNKLKSLSNQEKRIYNNLVVNLITHFETFIYKFYRLIITNNNQYLDFDLSISLRDIQIKNIESIEELREHSIAVQCEKFLKLNTNEYLNKLMSLNFNDEYYKKNVKNILEIFSRRNVIIHNDGFVNNQYIKESNNILNLQNKTFIETDLDYLINSSNILLTLITILVIKQFDNILYQDKNNLSDELSKDQHNLYYAFEKVSFSLLQSQQWDHCYYIYKVLSKIDEQNIMPFKEGFNLNYLLCGKKLNKSKELKLIKQYNYHAVKINFKIGALAISDKPEKILQTIINHDSLITELNEQSFLLWPIFKDLKKDPDWIKKIGDALETNITKYGQNT